MNTIIFNDQQKGYLASMEEFMKDPQETFYLLEGYAGTGKTTCIQELVSQMGLATALTAPTNKATRVLRDMSKQFNTTVDCGTIYSMLGLTLNGDAEKQRIVAEGESKIRN